MGMFESDPLLSTGRSLESLAQENEAYTQKLQALKQIPGITQQQRVSTPTPIWDEIDRIVSSLNDQERAVLNNNKEYYDNSMAFPSAEPSILPLTRRRTSELTIS